MTMSKSEAGYHGYIVTEARYGKATMDRWRRKGGRPRNKTLAEINAEARGLPGRKARSNSRREEGGVSND